MLNRSNSSPRSQASSAAKCSQNGPDEDQPSSSAPAPPSVGHIPQPDAELSERFVVQCETVIALYDKQSQARPRHGNPAEDGRVQEGRLQLADAEQCAYFR